MMTDYLNYIDMLSRQGKSYISCIDESKNTLVATVALNFSDDTKTILIHAFDENGKFLNMEIDGSFSGAECLLAAFIYEQEGHQ